MSDDGKPGIDPDDPILKSMRSVWLGMRDEDPPERGLAELMAAARTQADVMKPAEKEPWWRGPFAFLTRPPVMAAAALVVVIGGAVALKGRNVDDASMAPAIANREERAKEVTLGASDGDRNQLEKSKLEPTKAPEVEAPVVATPTPKPEAGPKLARPTVKPPVTQPEHGWGNAQEDVATNSGSATTPPPPPPPPPQVDPGAGLLIAGESKDIKTDRAPPAGGRSVPKPADSKPAADDEQGNETTTIKQTGRAPDPTEQLVKQAETAATRKDCPAVRATAARIKKTAPDAYKSRVITQPAIARCLK